MARLCTASINLAAIKHNYLYAKSLAPNSQAIAIIKADAYGHGAVEVATHLEDTVDAFGVACTEEAIEIREAGLEKKPILLLEGIFEQSELELLEKLHAFGGHVPFDGVHLDKRVELRRAGERGLRAL